MNEMKVPSYIMTYGDFTMNTSLKNEGAIAGNKQVRDLATCRVFQIKYSKIFQAEYFFIKSATKSCDV